jgi:hypothetical protein
LSVSLSVALLAPPAAPQVTPGAGWKTTWKAHVD